MTLSQGDIETIIALWKYSEQQADPRAPKDQVVSGLRREDLVSCQYWLKGLSPICNYWDEDSGCIYKILTGKTYPSGYNSGNCDYLGRRSTCDRYKTYELDNLEEYHCILPNIFLSGIGKKSGSTKTGITLSPIPKNEITGYCDGNCDGVGRGTGCDGSDPINDPVVCNYFRPWQMGFGALKPKDIRRRLTDKGEIYIAPEDIQAAYDDVDSPFESRLPLSFKIYNYRAEFQTCAYWKTEDGSRFVPNADGSIYLDTDASGEEGCSCTDALCTPYHTLATPASGTQAWLLDEVWSEAKTVVCNGAKPECPFYTGEWVYCNDINMLYGMRVTANQIFELRFWTSMWGSQSEYDEYFKSKPNWQDVPTADIYTFTKWLKLGETAADSVALGRILHMCQPASLNNKRFVPVDFLTAKDIKYTAAGINMGTTAPTAGQVYYPTLIRDLDLEGYLYKIDIIYPYASMDPFSTEPCNADTNKDPLGIKRGSSINGDTVSVIGATGWGRTVYTFNLNYIDNVLSEFNKHWMVGTISNIRMVNKGDSSYVGLSPRGKFFKKLEDFIDDIQKRFPNYVSKTTSDSETGFFQSDPIHLKYSEVNRIVVVVDFGNGNWDFRIRPTLSKWYGGLIIQESFIQSDIGRYLPERFYPPGKITGTIYPLSDDAGGVASSAYPKCYLDSVIHSASNTWTNEYLETYWRYTYCYKKITVTNEQIYNWVAVGNFGVVWVEIENTDINYLLEWGVSSVKMRYVGSDENEIHSEIEMDLIEIETFESGQYSVPPSACLIRPKDTNIKKMFFNGDWKLRMTYWYTQISGDNNTSDSVEISEPDFSNDAVIFEDSNINFTLNEDDNTFSISNVNDETIALMALFADEEGRIISAMSTKLLVQVSKSECRNVEIDYRYSQPTNWYKLIPETSMSQLATPPTKEQLQGDYGQRYFRPFCGDHKNGNQGYGRGAMWYPFYTCDECDFYQAYAGASYCTNWFPCGGSYGGYSTSTPVETTLGDFTAGGGGGFGGAGATGSWTGEVIEQTPSPLRQLRFCGPTKYTAFVAPGGGSSYAGCVLSFHYRYSVTTGEPMFAGYANIVAHVDPAEYASHNWMLPPFGNKGREMTRKFLSQDHWVHLSAKGSDRIYVTSQWVPMVPDNTDFFMSFNAFSESSVVSPDAFMHVNQLSFFTSNLIEEKIGTERKRFEDVFGPRGIWMASYPEPLLTQGQMTKALHYYFKDSNVVWAWREYWKEIEYVGDERSLYFVTYNRPDYLYDYEKVEHRFICDEGAYVVKYTPPVIEEGELIQYPSLQLGNGPKRFFNIVYDSYSGDVDWMDEGSGQVDGSREEGEEDNIYEVTSPNGAGSKWVHNVNCLFDDSAVRTYELAEAADKQIVYLDDEGVEVEYYYNTGLVVNLSRETLKFLPYEETEYELPFLISPPTNDSLGRGIHSWYNTDVKFTIDLSSEEAGSCMSEVKISGLWGLYKLKYQGAYTKRSACIPGVSVVEVYDGGTRTLATKDYVKFEKDIYGDIGIVDFELTFKLEPTVDRMLNKRAASMEIDLDCVGGQYLYINYVSLKAATYTNATEIINVYERKFITSTSDKLGSHNINGPKVGGNFVLQYDLDFDNSGTYYAISPELDYVPDGEINAKDKMRAVYASEQYSEDESLDININNISEIEQEEQKDLYQDALDRDTDGDTTVYAVTLPPALESFFELHNIQIILSGNLVIKTNKVGWEDHYLHGLYKEGTMWYPQGHKFQWSDKMRRMFCYEMDYMPEYGAHGRFDIMEVKFIHMDTFVGEFPADPLTALYANRMSYQLEVARKLFGTDAGFQDAGRLLGTASSFVDNTNVGDVTPGEEEFVPF